jgi:hypothetical protein
VAGLSPKYGESSSNPRVEIIQLDFVLCGLLSSEASTEKRGKEEGIGIKSD